MYRSWLRIKSESKKDDQRQGRKGGDSGPLEGKGWRKTNRMVHVPEHQVGICSNKKGDGQLLGATRLWPPGKQDRKKRVAMGKKASQNREGGRFELKDGPLADDYRKVKRGTRMQEYSKI